jgi:hypothetical protein
MPVRVYKSGGFAVDVEALLNSRFKRWVGKMDVREIKTHHQVVTNHEDVTGQIVLIGGIGVVDGFSTLARRKSGQVPVVIFELRNAERFIYHRFGPGEKDAAGRFKPHTFLGQLKQTFDLSGYQ